MKQLLQEYFESGEPLLKMDGFDDAIVGEAIQANKRFLVYDKKKILLLLQRDMSEEDAVEYFEYNIACAYVGENTPAIITEYKEEFEIERLTDDVQS